MQKKFKTKFINDFDIQVFNQDFYQILLENITKLKRQKESPKEILTCACLDTSNTQNGILACACLDINDNRTCACLDTSQTCLSQAKSKRKHV